jgi:hypothetical protein
MENNMKVILYQSLPVMLREYDVEFDNGTRLLYREWIDPIPGMVINYSLVNMDGDAITDEGLIELIQEQIEESLI